MEEEGNEGAEEVTTVEMRIESALAQCLHVLYGVDLPHRDSDWGSMEVDVSHSCFCGGYVKRAIYE